MSSPASSPYPSPRRAWYVVGLLTLAYMSSFIDRMVVNLLVDPIRRDMHLSDTQISLLMGLSFAVFYTLFGLPLGRLADATNRPRLIAAGILAWSAMTALCGVAKSYWQLLLARMGVGVGEAALSPAAYSLITDCFPKEKLATAMSVYSTGIYLGSGLALLLGALAIKLASVQEVWHLPLGGALFPWQMVFLIVAVPGLLIALLMLTIREPARRAANRTGSVPLREVVAFVRANARAIVCHNLGFALLVLAAYAMAAWVPTCLVRLHGATTVQAAVSFGLVVTVAGTAGTIMGGHVADRLTAIGYADGRMRTGLIAALAWLPCIAAFPFMPDLAWSIVLLIPVCLFSSFPLGAAAAAIQELAPARMRGQLAAMYLFVITLVGLGLGPTSVALLTDYAFADDLAVGYSLAIASVVALTAGSVVFLASFAPYRASLQQARTLAGLATRGS